MADHCYVVKYEDEFGRVKTLQDKYRGGVREFYNFNTAHKLKVWFDKKGYKAKVEICRL